MSAPPLRRLPLVAPEAQLSGQFPRGFERAAKGCKAGTSTHHAVLFAALTLAERGIRECLPPKERAPYLAACKTAWEWAQGSTLYSAVRDVRAYCFEHAKESEKQTLTVLTAALEHFDQRDPQPRSELGLHARSVTFRYAGLAVHHAIGAVLLALDACKEPRDALLLCGEVAGAIAYQKVALGPCRSAELQRSALTQAQWEAQRVQGSSQAHSENALAVQLFHEYLGVHWKNYTDAQRLYLEDFLGWAFPE